MSKLILEATLENLSRVLAFVDEQLEARDCPMKIQMQIDIAVEEIYVNIAHYAYAPNIGNAEITVDFEGSTAVLEFRDTGMFFDPLAKADPDVTLSAEQRQIGGLGIYMVKKSMDAVEYRYENGTNILTIRKEIG